jgi:S-adenosylmethionine hydrolase
MGLQPIRMKSAIRLALIVVACTAGSAQEPFKPNGSVILLTDYGSDSIYVGILKGAIYSKFGGARIDSITNAVPPFDIVAGAYLLAEAAGEFPTGTVFTCIVDPGVGTARKSIAVETNNGYCFVGPDNGLISLVARRYGVKQVRELSNKKLWRADTTSTVFHGRDIYGPVSASIAGGVPIEDVGDPLDEMVELNLPRSRVESGKAHGVIIRTDPYGNMVSNITAADLEALGAKQGDTLSVLIGKAAYSAPLKTTYAEVPEGERLVVLQSSGFVEFAINKASLVDAIREGNGATVTIERE